MGGPPGWAQQRVWTDRARPPRAGNNRTVDKTRDCGRKPGPGFCLGRRQGASCGGPDPPSRGGGLTEQPTASSHLPTTQGDTDPRTASLPGHLFFFFFFLTNKLYEVLEQLWVHGNIERFPTDPLPDVLHYGVPRQRVPLFCEPMLRVAVPESPLGHLLSSGFQIVAVSNRCAFISHRCFNLHFHDNT